MPRMTPKGQTVPGQMRKPPGRRADPDGFVALSAAQQGIWLLHQLDPDSPSYNLGVAIEIRGAVDSPALKRSLDAIVSRHEMLRATFSLHAGEPWQVVHAPAPAAFAEIDLRDMGETEGRKRAFAIASEEARRPFDLARLPLLRVTLISLQDRGHVLVVVHPPIVADALSMNRFYAELDEFYAGFLEGRTADLPVLPVQYADFSRCQRDWLEHSAGQ